MEKKEGGRANKKGGHRPGFLSLNWGYSSNYQGTIFFSPFFFLLLDSFFLSSEPCESLVLFASALCESPLADASDFAGCSLPAPDPAAAALPLESAAVAAPADAPGAPPSAPGPAPPAPVS